MDRRNSVQVQRLEVVDLGRRRRWSADAKLRIVEESFCRVAPNLGDSAAPRDLDLVAVRVVPRRTMPASWSIGSQEASYRRWWSTSALLRRRRRAGSRLSRRADTNAASMPGDRI